MNNTMEKYIEIDVATMVLSGQATADGTAGGNGPNKLNYSTGGFTANVTVGDWVFIWGVNGTAQAAGGHLYEVATIDSDVLLTLTPKGATAGQGTGVVDTGDFYIYSNTVTYSQMLSASNVVWAENVGTATSNTKFNVIYSGASGITCQVNYAYTGTVQGNEDMRNGLQTSVTRILGKNWPEISTKWDLKENNSGLSSAAYKVLDVSKI
tara:strand:+ start:2440 stop:3066 length:627 start_codon:yes stop_codon:yes gene_type:complete